MKYTLTNQPQKINETKGEIENLSPYTIVLAAGTATPTEDTARITVKPWGSYSFKVALGEFLYAWIINEESGTTTEVSVVNFSLESEGGDIVELNEQIQNLSKKLPSGTILAVDYKKGVTAQDYEGNLIEPNGIETTLGHDNGVFYNADASFQGGRNRAKGLWAGKGTVNILSDYSVIDKATTSFNAEVEDGRITIDITEDILTTDNRRLILRYDNLPLGENFAFSWGVEKKSDTLNIKYFELHGDSFTTEKTSVEEVGSLIGTIANTGIGIPAFAIRLGDCKAGDKLIVKVNFEKSPIPTPFCEKSRGGMKNTYKNITNLVNYKGVWITKFFGKVDGSYGLCNNPGFRKWITGFGKENEWNTMCTYFNGETTVSHYVNGNFVTSYFGGEGMNNTTSKDITFWNYNGIAHPNLFVEYDILAKGTFTVEEIKKLSSSNIEIPDIGEYYPIAYAKKRTDQYGAYKRGWTVVSTDEDIFEIKNKRYKVTHKTGVEEIVYIDENGVKTGTALDQVNGYLRANSSIDLPCDVEVL